jgi:hypothetical protein
VVPSHPAADYNPATPRHDDIRSQPTGASSRKLDDRPSDNGAKFEWDLGGFGMVIQELQEFEPDVQLRIVLHIRPLEGGHRFRLTASGERDT